jgi:hypothetical protein
MSVNDPPIDNEGKQAPTTDIESNTKPKDENTIEGQTQYLTGFKLFLILLSLYLAVFLVALVSHLSAPTPSSKLTQNKGPHNNRNRHPAHHR